jgi:hypothetical protein
MEKRDRRMEKRARESREDRVRVDRQDCKDRERAERSEFRKSAMAAAAPTKLPLQQGEHRAPKKDAQQEAQQEGRQGHAPREVTPRYPASIALAVPPDPGEPSGESTPSVPSCVPVAVPPDPGDPEGEPSPAPDHTPANPKAIGESLNFDGTTVPQSEQRLFLKNTLYPAGSTIHRGDAALGGHVSRAEANCDLRKMCADESSRSTNSSSSDSSGTSSISRSISISSSSSSSSSTSRTSTQSVEGVDTDEGRGEGEEVLNKEARSPAPKMTGDIRHTQVATLLDSLMHYNRRTLTTRISVRMQLARHGSRLVEDRRTAREA